MARRKQTARHTEKVLITWTRFYLPREQELPIWTVDHDNVHVGPLAGVEGWRKASLGRMVDNPEQAAYIIQWVTLDALKNFQSSPACIEFLRNLPEIGNSRVSGIESGAALRHLTLDDASSSSSSRFLTLKHADSTPTSEVEGRVTFTSFLVPCNVDNVSEVYQHSYIFRDVFCTFEPRGSQRIKRPSNFWYKFLAVWFWALSEDRWVAEKFGKLEQTQNSEDSNNQGRTIFCHFHLWSSKLGATPEHEEASAADPQTRESWIQRIAQVMPPATAWVQERWDIRGVPLFEPPEPELDPEEDPEYAREQRRLLKEYLKSHGFEVGEESQGG